MFRSNEGHCGGRRFIGPLPSALAHLTRSLPGHRGKENGHLRMLAGERPNPREEGQIGPVQTRDGEWEAGRGWRSSISYLCPKKICFAALVDPEAVGKGVWFCIW